MVSEFVDYTRSRAILNCHLERLWGTWEGRRQGHGGVVGRHIGSGRGQSIFGTMLDRFYCVTWWQRKLGNSGVQYVLDGRCG